MDMLPKAGSPEYERHVRAEVEHYTRVYSQPPAALLVGAERLFQPVPPAWVELETRAAELIRVATGADLTGHLLARLRRTPGARLLTLGSGPGGIELALAREVPSARIVCVDLNPELLEIGRGQARREDLNVRFEAADLNTLTLPPNCYDLVFCHAALHHVIELEHVAAQIAATLPPTGELIVVDVITRRGYRMWPETRAVVQALWNTLPPRFRLNHTAYAQPRLDEQIWEADTSASSMECIRSEDILCALHQRFAPRHFFGYYTLCRRFFDTMYGPNYDLGQPLDRALFDWIWHLDLLHSASGSLRPETFFGIYSPKPGSALPRRSA
jgi:ubiquinone/menaquinone biosynthesis C-methylase UbiE